MAQPTVTARPATWAGTSGPILYKFTSTNYASAGYYMAVEIWDNIAAAKIADAKFYSDTSGNVIVNVANFLKDNMSLENNSNIASVTTFTDNNWINYYIKYREFWTAGSESQVDDVANLRYAIYGGLQLGSINSFASYIPGDSAKKFLNLAGSASINRAFTISVIGSSNMAVRVDRYLNSTYVESRGEAVTANAVNRVNAYETVNDRVDFTLFSPSTETYSNGRAVGAGFPFDSLTLGNASSSGVAAGDFNAINRAYSGTQDVPVILLIDVTSTNLTGAVTLNFSLFNAAKSLSVNITPVPITYNGIYAINLLSSTFDPAFIELILDNGSAGAVDWELDVIETVASKTVTIPVKELCDNTVMLQWKNSLGGDECYPFQINQEYTFQYGDRKAKRLTLFAEGLTLTQWEAIQGLNTNGELYKTPITEMLTTTNRTMKTVGQSVNIYNSDGTKTGVNVINQTNTTNTKQKTHSAVVTIEYPELFLQ